MSYFAHCTTLDEIKAEYRTLAMRWHPDRPGGDTATMQQINAAYHAALKTQDGATRTNAATGDTYTYTYKYAAEQEVVDQIAKTLAARILVDGHHEFLLVGRWLWVRGETRPIKNQLAAAGYSWHSKRLAWYWKPANSFSRFNDKASLDDLATIYGSTTIHGSTHAGHNQGATPRSTPIGTLTHQHA